MKKSDILNLISDHFEGNGVYEEEALEKAAKLLTALEEHGMLPPEISSGCYDNYGNELGINDWEDE